MIVVEASQPDSIAPFIPGPKPRDFVFRTTSLVTSLIVRSPVTSKVSSPVFFQDLLLKVMAGSFAAEKNLSLRRSSSRMPLRVSTLATSILASTVLFSRWARSTAMVPENLVKAPGTLVKKWRIVNPTDECTGSIL